MFSKTLTFSAIAAFAVAADLLESSDTARADYIEGAWNKL